jgi:hypothetical protein
MYSIDPARRRGLVRRPFPGLVGLGLFLLLVVAALASARTVFPFFLLFPLVLFFGLRTIGNAAWHGRPSAIRRPTDNPPALPSGISKEKESFRSWSVVRRSPPSRLLWGPP